MEIVFDLSQQLILIFFLLLELLELPLRVIFVLSDQSLLAFHVFDHALQLFNLGLVLFGIVKQLFLVLLEYVLVILQLVNHGLLGLDLSSVLFIDLLNFFLFLSLNFFNGFLMPIIELQQLVIQALNLSLLLLIYLDVSHQLQVAIYLAELALVTGLPILAEREAKTGFLKILFDAIF